MWIIIGKGKKSQCYMLLFAWRAFAKTIDFVSGGIEQAIG
jgi:hypothetical protein